MMAHSLRRRSSGLSVLLFLLLAASPAWAQYHRLPGYTFTGLPAGAPAGAKARVTDQDNAIYMSDGSTWRSSGEFVGTKLIVPGPAVPATPYTGSGSTAMYSGIVGIGSILDSVALTVNATLHSTGTVTGVRISPTLHPDTDRTIPADGDAYGIRLLPTMHVSQHSIGPVGSGAHKNFASIRVAVPVLVVNSPGLPQDVSAIHITNESAGLTPDSVLSGLWAIRTQGGMASQFTGAISIESSGATPIFNIKIGSGTVAAPTGAKHGNALRIAARIAPIVDVTFNAQGEGFLIRSGGSFNTDAAGTHVDLGNAYILTPTLGTAGGAGVTNFTTLKVGNAPAGIGGSVNRALWVGTGLTEIEGNVTLTGTLTQVGVVFASLSTVNGTLTYCTDCTIANPCAGGGGGAYAKRLNGVHVCN